MRIARPGPGERLPPDHPLRHAELLADAPHLVLEEQAQRLDELHRHVVGQPADVVMRLDRLGDAVGAARLDHVGVERPLHEPVHVAELARLVLEDADELLADDHALALRIGDACELGDEALLRLDVHERHVVEAVERLDHLLGLALAQQAVVDEHAGELVADRLVHEQRGDRRVDAARERAEHPLACRPRRGSARPAPRSRRPASRTARRRRRRRGSSSGPPGRAACAPPRDGTGRRRASAPRPRTPRPVCAPRWRRCARPTAARRRCRGATSRRSDPPAASRRARLRSSASRPCRTRRRRSCRRARRGRARAAARRNRCRASGCRARRSSCPSSARPPRRPTRGRPRGSARSGCGAGSRRPSRDARRAPSRRAPRARAARSTASTDHRNRPPGPAAPPGAAPGSARPQPRR